MINNKYLRFFILTSILAGTIGKASAEEKTHAFTIETSMFYVDQKFKDLNYLDSGNKILPGIGYNYKFKIDNNIFIRPGLVANFFDIKIEDINSSNVTTKISTLHSYYFDIGSKINNQISAYATLGSLAATISRIEEDEITENKDRGITMGLGVTYNISDKFDIDFKYQTTNIEVDVINSNFKYEILFNVFKLSSSYKF